MIHVMIHDVLFNRPYITYMSCYITSHIRLVSNRVLYKTYYITTLCMLYNAHRVLYSINGYITPCYITGVGCCITGPNLPDASSESVSDTLVDNTIIMMTPLQQVAVALVLPVMTGT
jgi:hypothetical protein